MDDCTLYTPLYARSGSGGAFGAMLKGTVTALRQCANADSHAINDRSEHLDRKEVDVSADTREGNASPWRETCTGLQRLCKCAHACRHLKHEHQPCA